MMHLAVIPARGGSKRIPGKNIKTFMGRPMIAHAIALAQRSGLFAKVVVSTDDAAIADIAMNSGAEIPFTRPKYMADDFTPTVPVVAHAIAEMEIQGQVFDTVCCIYPGAYFSLAEDLLGAFEALQTSGADYCFPVCEFVSPVQRALQLSKEGLVRPLYPEFANTRTQDLVSAYHDAGQFYWGKREAWVNGRSLHSNGCGYEVPYWRIVDIDTPEDWERAELLAKVLSFS